ncbi:hypothetical protein JXA40_00100 [bacterium]|nr:hypothetical protein [candidate division CSSED10-310 bacterium]
MKRMIGIGIAAIALLGVTASYADSFGFYYRSSGFGMGMEFRDYDYYDRYSPGFYDQTDMDFYAALGPYGEWVYLGDFDGYIWIPHVSMTWRPYSYGTWTYTSYGWTWVAYEPWGWIPHHYGRWFYHPSYRWIWIPGTTWGPAYVTWGYYNGYYGWAPLPPQNTRYYRHSHRYYRDRHSDHYDRSSHWYGHHNDYESSNYRWIPNDAWTFVGERNFLANNAMDYSADRETAGRIFRSNHFVPLEKAPSTRQIEKVTGKPVTRMQVDETVKNMKGEKIKVVRPSGVLERNHDSVLKTRSGYEQNLRKNKPTDSQKNIRVEPNTHSQDRNQSTIQPEPNRINKPVYNPPQNRDRHDPVKQSKPSGPVSIQNGKHGKDIRTAPPAQKQEQLKKPESKHNKKSLKSRQKTPDTQPTPSSDKEQPRTLQF